MPTKKTKKMNSAAKDEYRFRKRDLLKHASNFSRAHLLIVAAVFAAIGGYVLYSTFVAGPVIATAQAEQMNLPTGASVYSDTTASGGQAVKLSQSGLFTGSVSLPSA